MQLERPVPTRTPRSHRRPAPSHGCPCSTQSARRSAPEPTPRVSSPGGRAQDPWEKLLTNRGGFLSIHTEDPGCPFTTASDAAPSLPLGGRTDTTPRLRTRVFFLSGTPRAESKQTVTVRGGRERFGAQHSRSRLNYGPREAGPTQLLRRVKKPCAPWPERDRAGWAGGGEMQGRGRGNGGTTGGGGGVSGGRFTAFRELGRGRPRGSRGLCEGASEVLLLCITSGRSTAPRTQQALSNHPNDWRRGRNNLTFVENPL